MEYAREVLAKFAKIEGSRRRSKRFVSSVECAYCRGTGEDPKYGNGSKCPVCGATGEVRVAPPVVTCLKWFRNGARKRRFELSGLPWGGSGVRP